MIWFTSDQHFGHDKIRDYCNRPFSTVGEMDSAMISRWNEVIGDDDIVYHLGDFTLGEEAKHYFSHLNGSIRVLGNRWHHDKRWLQRWLDSEVWYSKSRSSVRILPALYLLTMNKEHVGVEYIVLCHYPLARWDRQHYGSWHLHGHTHNRYQGDGFCMDVGVDAHDFYPVSLDQVEATMRKKGWHEEWREYE